MKLILILVTILLLPIFSVNGFAEVFQERLEGTLNVYTNQVVFAPGEPMFVYGQATSKEPLIIRLFAPDSTIAEFEQIMTKEDGSFHHYLISLHICSNCFMVESTESLSSPSGKQLANASKAATAA